MASYGRAAQKFQDWRLQPSLSPPSDTEVISYLTELYQSTSSATSVQSTATALSWFFKFSSSPNPCESPWVIAFLQGLRRSKPDTVHRKKISREHLRLILAADRQQLRDHRIVALLGVLYAACLRPTEGVTLTRDAISVDRVGLIISVAKDKTNKTGSPRQVPVQWRQRGLPGSDPSRLASKSTGLALRLPEPDEAIYVYVIGLRSQGVEKLSHETWSTTRHHSSRVPRRLCDGLYQRWRPT
ncbi:hypothetical protein L596_026972 [Steinernema carpocapsae]|uniref:Tyr recombinase domain-containing protein n=1 Tax=Steinernema carpocapsae TaxID=34508 RepID=A0A4U5M307_STECR|nr:hypothetical protein L596_026972 [Steinernema carpocapsae]